MWDIGEMMELWDPRRLGTDSIASRDGCKQGVSHVSICFISQKTMSQTISCFALSFFSGILNFSSYWRKAGPLISNQKSQNLLMTALDMGEAIVESTEAGENPMMQGHYIFLLCSLMFWVWRIIVWEFDIARLRYNIFQCTTCSMHLFSFFFTSVQLKHQKKNISHPKDMSSVLPSLFPSGSQSNGFATGPVEWLRWKWCCHSSCGAWRVLPLLVDHERSVERCGVSPVASVKVGKQSPKVWRLQNILGKMHVILCIVYILL